MSMRSQVYEWSNLAPSGSSSSLRRTVDAVPVDVPVNREYDIFIGGIGNNITKPAETTATQFIVIEDIACSAYLGGALQVRINTTDYFQNPDVTDQAGVPGLASPYPRGSSDKAVADALTDSVQLLKSFDLYPDVYVLRVKFSKFFTPCKQATQAHLLPQSLPHSLNTPSMTGRMHLSQTNSWNLV